MKIFFTSVFAIIFSAFIFSQEKTNQLNLKLYGFVRGDFTYDTRQSVAANEGLFFLYPRDKDEDANGDDLNAVSNSGFYTFNTRFGVDASGLNAFNADLSLKVEADFAGFSGASGGTSTVLRIRQAYMKANWTNSSLLLGQTWHPMFLPVFPDVISLATGAPFNPFNRSPQVRFDYRANCITITGAGIYQLQSASIGPEGKTNSYQRNAVIPELYFGLNYNYRQVSAGIGIDYLTLKPRTRSNFGENVYKVDETISSLSYSAYCKYAKDLFSVSAKTIYGQNLSNMSMLGGFGIKEIDPNTGEQKYTNFTHSSTWLNVSYGSKYRGNLFAGYTKNLGSKDELVESTAVYGEGMTIDNLYRLCGTFTYNIPKFTIGLEYEFTTAAYGDAGTFDWKEGKYNDTHSVGNHRIVGVICYNF